MQNTIMIVGPSQIGKSAAIAQLAAAYDYEFVTTYTTRAPRDEERDGHDYHFLTEQKFQQMIVSGGFVDWDYFLNSYGGIGCQSFLRPSARPMVMHVLARMALRILRQRTDTRAVFLAPRELSLVIERIRTRFPEPIANARIALANEEMLHSRMFEKVVAVESMMSVEDVAREIHTCISKP